MSNSHISEPLDLVKLSLDEEVIIKCKGDRELCGKLHAYDPHLNLILGPVKEIVRTKTLNSETGKELYTSTERAMEMLFVRGDGVILISPSKSTSYKRKHPPV